MAEWKAWARNALADRGYPDDDDRRWAWFLLGLERPHLSWSAVAARVGAPRVDVEEAAAAGLWSARRAEYVAWLDKRREAIGARIAAGARALVLERLETLDAEDIEVRDLGALLAVAKAFEPPTAPSGAGSKVDLSTLTDDELDALHRADAIRRRLTGAE